MKLYLPKINTAWAYGKNSKSFNVYKIDFYNNIIKYIDGSHNNISDFYWSVTGLNIRPIL